MAGDNFRVEVCSSGREHFEAAVQMAFANAAGGRATHYISPVPALNCVGCVGGKKVHWVGEAHKQPCEYPCSRCGGSGVSEAHAGMILLWHEDQIGDVEASMLPFPMDAEAATEFLWAYLRTADYGKQPDHDGDNKEGYIVTTGDFWGHVGGSQYAFLGVYPDWQMYGK